jgi:hypothetical protein
MARQRGQNRVVLGLFSGSDGSGAGAFFAALHFKFDGIAFFEAVEVEVLETAAVKENLLPFGGPDKSETAIANDTFN